MNHNKKRNTAFLFEILVKEQTKCVLNKQNKKAKFIEKIIHKFFGEETVLRKELELYNCLLETNYNSSELAEKLISYVKQEHQSINEKQLFETQSKLIHLMNRSLGQDVFESFIPNYKNLATINIIWNKKAPLALKVEMEQIIKESLIKQEKKIELIKEDVNLLHFRKFMENFNEKYSTLLEEQKELLNKFILFKFGDEIDFKVYLNRECNRLLEAIESNKEKVKDNKELYENIDKCVDNLKSSSLKHMDDVFVYSIMKYQELAKELNSGT